MTTKRMVMGLVAAVALVAVMSQISWGERLLTEEKALKEMLPGVDRVEKVTRTLTDDEIGRIKGRIKTMTLHQEGSEAKKMDEVRDYTFYFGIKGDKKVGVVLFDIQPGKWGPVSFVLALDTQTAKVTNMAVTAYVEKRGRPIALRSFLSQFFGKGSNDPLDPSKDYRAISGATISSKCAAFVVRKACTLYEELFLNAPSANNSANIDPANRAKVMEELAKSSKEQKDKLLGQLVGKLSDATTSMCHKQSITLILNTYAQPEADKKLQSSKFPPDTTSLTENLAEALEKLAGFGQFKVTWTSDKVKESAKLVKMNNSIQIKETDTVQAVLETVLTAYGCAHCRKSDDKTTYSYILKGDSIEITDMESAQKYWQGWLDSSRKQASK
ncbi:MAG: FMN-binding protein [Planctomycetes bacterium]|nr:FMN-binding protein [Planctomycetota bacterium]